MAASSAITVNGLNMMLNRAFKGTPTLEEPTYFKVGIGTTVAASTDTDLSKPLPVSGSTTIDACDADTGWSNEDDADAEAVNSTAGQFKEGTGCLNLPTTYSAGTAGWYKTVSSQDLTTDNNYFLVWFYIVDSSDLTTSSSAVRITLGTSGFTNVNYYDTANTSIADGWNLLVFDADDPTSTGGTGADESDVDSIKLTVLLDSSQATNDMRMDFWHSCTETQQLVSFESGFPSLNTTDIQATTKGIINETSMNDGAYEVNEIGLFSGDSPPKLMWRDVLATDINKTSSVRLILEGIDKVEEG